jgi:hypothetical protein
VRGSLRSGATQVRGGTVLEYEGLRRKTIVVGSVTDAFMWRNNFLGCVLSCMESGILKGTSMEWAGLRPWPG